MDTYDKDIRKNLQTFYEDVEMPGNYRYNHAETIRTIDLYYNSKYKTGQYDALGFRKFFYNIVKPACDIATKFIDLDTKDIILIPESPDSEMRVWFLQKKLKQKLKIDYFGVLLNEIAFDLPKYGSVVIRKHKKKWRKLNIQNLRMHPAAKSLEDSPFVYELMTMSRGEIDDMKWDKDAIKELYSRCDDEEFIVYNCYHKSGDQWYHAVKADVFAYNKDGALLRTTEADINDNSRTYLPAITLFEDETDEFPYREVHWERVPGRWLGYGFVEYLEENQIAINEAENLERSGLKFTSLKVYQTRDDAVGGSNILSNTQNGDIIKVDSEITALPMEERNLAAFNNTRSNWTANTERKTFTTDITTGANLPSRTPLGVANLQASFASSYFELKRENYGLFLKELVMDDLLPDCQKSSVKEHILVFSSSEPELDKLDQAIADILVGQAIMDKAEETGFFPSKEQRDDARRRVLSELQKKTNRYYQIPKDFYRDAKYTVDVNITGESVDNGTRSQIVQLALQIVGQNPGVLQNAPARSMLFYLLSLGGISPADLNLTAQPEQQPQQPVEQGGSLSSPTPVQGLVTSTTTV